MSRFNYRILSMGLVLGVVPWLTLRAAELWVAPDGSDRNPGTAERPFASVAAAQRSARELRRLVDPSVAAGVRIVVRGGFYSLTSPLFFRPEDSGTAASPTIVEAAAGEHPVLSGGVKLSGWRIVQEDVPGLPMAAKGQVWVADAPRIGGRAIEVRQLWVGDRKGMRARSTAAGVMERLLGWDRERREAVIGAPLVASLKDTVGLEMFVQQQWEIAILRVKTIRIEGDRAYVAFQEPESQLEFEHPWPQPILPPKGGGAFFLSGRAEFLDQPGEWWQESPGGRIFYWPQDREDLTKLPVVVGALPTLLEVSGTLDRPVEHVQFKGIGFAHTAWLRPGTSGHVPLQAGMHLLDAYKLKPPGTPDRKGLENQAWVGRMAAGVVVTGADHVGFERCRFEHFGASGLDMASGVRDGGVEGCVFYDIGGNGAQVGAFQTDGIETHLPYNPSVDREVTARIRLVNNLVTDCANEDWGCVGLDVGYARECAIDHNEVVDVSYTGISVGWGWTKTANASRDHRVHANLLRRVATRMCDTAGIYTLSAQPGTIVSENSVEQITMSPYVDLPNHWFYLYTDEGSSFVTVRDNWCPEEKFLRNANGSGNVWERNGPTVSPAIKSAAGLEPAFRDLRTSSSD